ncbi:50S ribosomal protein L3 [Candidatus Uhrbacteria bacterium CG10_big_fil_rev_8_21_14_0_10_50_16]|uniref:Large ribosomal subunit protein uL3 n=1 Tax=Candidatus Uhrbacteria bacterium CG10_big_fil_rev_8_21_14_0_10_50_16 TaxID=1975039 RepID=A0A2H0RLX7_9BACT|nr:MAG: 50S ribosomal protein L3 [Candidatus Uhrbacteria bacterium CG10_big_fil_rev_8_21_14_0_10_50_16]
MKCIIGRKLEMTQVFREDGTVVPVTLIQAGPCTVTDVRTVDANGYAAVQLGYGVQKASRVAKAQLGQWLESGPFQLVKEVRVSDPSNYEVGATVDASIFEAGDKIDVIGTSKGRGFQGVVKRHGFRGSKTTHGNKDQQRMPGSIGATGPQRVFKGMRMAGRMGGDRTTVQNLEIVEVRPNGLVAVKGAVPGSRNSLIVLKSVK